MVREFRMRRMVEFAETDMAGIMYFANFFQYMESVEHAFFRSLGFRVHGGDGAAAWGWARRHAEMSYQRPLRYEDEVELHLLVREVRTKSIVYETRFLLDSPEGQVEVARGSITAVCVEKTASGEMRAVAMPQEIRAAIGE
jgi:acyl-CoA thioester hydrolase